MDKAAEATRTIWAMDPDSINKDHISSLSKDQKELFIANYGKNIYITLVKYVDLLLIGYVWFCNHDILAEPETKKFDSILSKPGLRAFRFDGHGIVELPTNFVPMFITIGEAARRLAFDKNAKLMLAAYRLYREYIKK